MVLNKFFGRRRGMRRARIQGQVPCSTYGGSQQGVEYHDSNHQVFLGPPSYTLPSYPSNEADPPEPAGDWLPARLASAHNDWMNPDPILRHRTCDFSYDYYRRGIRSKIYDDEEDGAVPRTPIPTHTVDMRDDNDADWNAMGETVSPPHRPFRSSPLQETHARENDTFYGGSCSGRFKEDEPSMPRRRQLGCNTRKQYVDHEDDLSTISGSTLETGKASSDYSLQEDDVFDALDHASLSLLTLLYIMKKTAKDTLCCCCYK